MGLTTNKLHGAFDWPQLLRAGDDVILEWAANQPWAREMAGCQQDAGWHAEGDVWTHTCMVWEALRDHAEWSALDRASQITLLMTALFHDSGKPVTTAPDPQTGRIRSPKHALVGAEVARRVLRDLGCELEVRERVVHMVRYHSRPGYLAEQPQFDRPVIFTSWFLSNRLLHLFAVADTLGRRMVDAEGIQLDLDSEVRRAAANGGRALERLELWRLAAEEHNCYDRRYPFANDHARFLFYRDALSSLHYVPHEEYRCAVTMLSGMPASGKDTWLSQQRPALPVVSLDELRTELDVDPADDQGAVAAAARERVKEHLRARRDFAFNATNLTRHTRRRWIDLFADYGARIDVVYLEPPVATILERNGSRERPVPQHVMKALISKLDPPTIAECHSLQFVS